MGLYWPPFLYICPNSNGQIGQQWYLCILINEKINPTGLNCHVSLGYFIRKWTKVTHSMNSARGKRDTGPDSRLPTRQWHSKAMPDRLYAVFLLSFPPANLQTAQYPDLNKDTFAQSSLEVGRLVQGRLIALDGRRSNAWLARV